MWEKQTSQKHRGFINQLYRFIITAAPNSCQFSLFTSGPQIQFHGTPSLLLGYSTAT